MQSIQSDVVKVAIKANCNALLFIINQTEPLEDIIREICVMCSIDYVANKYALQLLPPATDVFMFITEQNRNKIKNGNELELVYSPTELVKMIKNKLSCKVTIENLSWALKKAVICSQDPVFCKEFFTTGYPELQSLLGKVLPTVDLYLKSLEVILNLIKSGFLKSLDRGFVLQLKDIITSETYVEEGILEKALGILEAVVLARGDSEFVTNLLSLDEFIHHIWSRGCPTVQGNTLALINAMVLKSSKIKTQKEILHKMNSKPLKDFIFKNVITTDSPVPNTLANALYVYQSLILVVEKERFRNVIKSETLLPVLIPCLTSGKIKSETKEMIDAELFGSECQVENFSSTISKRDVSISMRSTSINSSVLSDLDEEVFDDSVFSLESKSGGYKKDKYISQLTFDCLFYFFNNYRDEYKIALLDDGHSYSSLFHTCERIVDILCGRVMRIGEIPEYVETNYCPLVFNTSYPFLEELFSKTVSLLNKTKREMKARSSSDLDKVFQVLQRQLLEGLSSQPTSFEQLESILGSLSYWKVRKQWEEEQETREQQTLTNSPAVKQLKESLVPEIKEVVKKQRLQFVKNKTEFPVWNIQRNQRVKNKTWFAFLTPNEKAIQYYNNEKEVYQLLVHNITSLVTGKRCPHMKNSKSKTTSNELAFSLLTEDSSLDFIAPTQDIYDHWIDAMNALLGNEMSSDCMKEDMQSLMEMEVRLRLLDVEGIDLPSEPPPVPLDPPNYDFCMRLTDFK